MVGAHEGPADRAARHPGGALGPVLAVDIGGTKLAAAVAGPDGRLSAASTCPTPATGDAEELFAALCALLDDVLSRAGPRPVVCGVGCGGPMRAGGEEVSPLNIPAWRGFPLRARLADALGMLVAVENDAKALALGEGWLGAARGVDH
ncbi:MAG TPA: ROK family protein, partial [Acidimicrobiales bacterium]|nr:ROK family protein [Acidimicrobiales bacterium]